jgi:hypothetical protein
VQSDQNPSPSSTSQATCLLKAKGKASCGYAFGLKSPKTEKKIYDFEMHYTSKLRVIVCSSLENIAQAVLLSTEPQSPKHWHSECNFKLKIKRYKGRKEGWRVAIEL